MIKRLKNRIAAFLKKEKRKKASRKVGLDIHPEDVFLVSYPRSGNTWVRFLLANLFKRADEAIDFHNIHEYIPEEGRNNDIINTLSSPRIIKTHSAYKANYPRVIYLVRDGRDVYVSYYHYRLKILPEGCSFSEFLRMDDHSPCLWGDHVESWLSDKGQLSGILIVSYENLLTNPNTELKRMVDFIGIQVTEEEIIQAVHASRFENMREIDQTKGRKYNLTGTDEFIRKGIKGEWREQFSQDDIDFFNKREGKILIDLGYEESLEW